MYENLSIANLMKALEELRDTVPDIRITAIAPLPDGVCIQGADIGVVYKYEYATGLLYTLRLNDNFPDGEIFMDC